MTIAACSTFDSSGSGSAATANVSIACDGNVCSGEQICCEHRDGKHECLQFEKCSASEDQAILCDDPSDCATGTCCVDFEDVFHVSSVRCGECAPADGRYQACNPTKTDCPKDKSCRTLDSVKPNGLQLDINVCN